MIHLCPRFNLLFVVVTGRVQNKQAVAQRADRDTCRRRTVFTEPDAPPRTLSTQMKAAFRPLTFQGSVVNALLEFGLLHNNSAVRGEEQLAGPSLVAFSVILSDWHCILGTE